jgi:hypothetical protein
MREESIAERQERGFHAVTEAVPRYQAFACTGLMPAFEGAIRHRRSRRPKACGMEELPNSGEVGEVFAFEDLAEVDLDKSRPREAGVVAHQPNLVSVGAKAPESLIGVIEPILQGGSSGSPAAEFCSMRCGEEGARAVQVVRWRNDDHGNATLLCFESNGLTFVTTRFDVRETKHLAE